MGAPAGNTADDIVGVEHNGQRYCELLRSFSHRLYRIHHPPREGISAPLRAPSRHRDSLSDLCASLKMPGHNTDLYFLIWVAGPTRPSEDVPRTTSLLHSTRHEWYTARPQTTRLHRKADPPAQTELINSLDARRARGQAFVGWSQAEIRSAETGVRAIRSTVLEV